jgi:hypothetical protein
MKGTEIRGLEGMEEIDTLTRTFCMNVLKMVSAVTELKLGRDKKSQGIVFDCEILAEHFACGQR